MFSFFFARILCHLYPDEIVTTSYHDKGVRLINDAFTKICSAVTDPSVSVRALVISNHSLLTLYIFTLGL